MRTSYVFLQKVARNKVPIDLIQNCDFAKLAIMSDESLELGALFMLE